MAHTKSLGTTRLGRDSQPKYLGVKRNQGQRVLPGQIIIRQRGTHYIPGQNVKRGSDDTLYALKAGIVRFLSKKKIRFDRSHRYVKIVTVSPA